ncbi:MAG: hypothetical protein ACHQFW_02745, partial [Chitinophagales bacterium]
MKRLFTLIITLQSIVIFAQPTITSSVAGGIGDEFSSTIVTTDGFDPGTGGADMTWDFSGISTSGTLAEGSLIDPEETGHAAEFPGANVASMSLAGNYGYFKLTASEYSLIGYYSAASTILYSDPEEIFIFPLTYGTSNTDGLYSEFFSGGDIIREGGNVLSADGYGTLKLPSGTYSNVLRVKLEEDYSDTYVDFPLALEYNFDTYYWLKEGVLGPLFSYSYTEVIAGGPPSVSESYSINNNVDITSIENNVESILLSMYPNPAT